MKKLLLITFLFLITPNAKADMDYLCSVDYLETLNAISFIEDNCERNNILYFQNITKIVLSLQIAYWCRQDREIHYIETSFGWNLTCVLYDNKPRRGK